MAEISRFVPVNQFSIHSDDKANVLAALNDGWISSEGPYVQNFEKQLSQNSKLSMFQFAQVVQLP